MHFEVYFQLYVEANIVCLLEFESDHQVYNGGKERNRERYYQVPINTDRGIHSSVLQNSEGSIALKIMCLRNIMKDSRAFRTKK